MKTLRALSIISFLFYSTSFAQSVLKITMKDGNVVKGASTLTKINITTAYGKLDIPLKNIYSIKLGIQPANNTSTLENKVTLDLIEIDNQFIVCGQSDIKMLELKTDYGMLSISRDKMASIDITDAAEGNNSYRLQASKNISANPADGWVNTGIVLKSGQSFSLSSSGEISLASLSNAKCSPDGQLYDETTGESFSYDLKKTNKPTFGSVVYRIGETGEVIKSGNELETNAYTSGTLYLSIYDLSYTAANGGYYTVKVNVEAQ